jgi:mannose-6-phosphate isomerase-like protein (cupin superfamily)
MTVELFDVLNAPEIPKDGRKKVLFNSDRYQVWIHGEWPGNETANHMHKHSADEMFYCLRGACVFHLPDGSKKELTPGKMVVIPKGDLYRIENTGGGYLALLGTRAESDGMQRWDAAGKPAESDTREGRQVAAAHPRRDGR